MFYSGPSWVFKLVFLDITHFINFMTLLWHRLNFSQKLPPKCTGVSQAVWKTCQSSSLFVVTSSFQSSQASGPAIFVHRSSSRWSSLFKFSKKKHQAARQLLRLKSSEAKLHPALVGSMLALLLARLPHRSRRFPGNLLPKTPQKWRLGRC